MRIYVDPGRWNGTLTTRYKSISPILRRLTAELNCWTLLCSPSLVLHPQGPHCCKECDDISMKGHLRTSSIGWLKIFDQISSMVCKGRSATRTWHRGNLHLLWGNNLFTKSCQALPSAIALTHALGHKKVSPQWQVAMQQTFFFSTTANFSVWQAVTGLLTKDIRESEDWPALASGNQYLLPSLWSAFQYRNLLISLNSSHITILARHGFDNPTMQQSKSPSCNWWLLWRNIHLPSLVKLNWLIHSLPSKHNLSSHGDHNSTTREFQDITGNLSFSIRHRRRYIFLEEQTIEAS